MLLFLGEWLIPPSYISRPPAHWIIVPNLRVIDNQKRIWAAEHQKHNGDTPTPEDLAPYFQGGKFPQPVIGETYHINRVGLQPTATAHSRLKMGKMTIEAGGTIIIPHE